MAIRCASKAIIIENGAVLLNRCKREDGCIYYDLPGGGQKPYESMEQTLLREVMEETGYEIRLERFVGLAEEINTNAELREKYPEYTHRILHIFTASLTGEKKDIPTEKDLHMEASVWVPLDEIDNLQETRPSCLKQLLRDIRRDESPRFYGTEYREEE